MTILAVSPTQYYIGNNKMASKNILVASSTQDGDYTTEEVEVVDKYPEACDNQRNIYVAIIYQSFNGEFGDLYKNLWQVADEILGDSSVYGDWKSEDSSTNKHLLIFGINNGSTDNVNFALFESYIETIDQRTDGDDRLILFIIGHGVMLQDELGYNRYYLCLMSGERIPSGTLSALLSTLGPALDFLWIFSCYSALFGESADALNGSARGFVLWAYSGATEILSMAGDAKNLKNAFVEGITEIENAYDFVNGKNLTEFDYYPGYLDIPELAPAFEEEGSGGGGYYPLLVPIGRGSVILPL